MFLFVKVLLLLMSFLCLFFPPSGDSAVEQEVKTDREVRAEQLHRVEFIDEVSPLIKM